MIAGNVDHPGAIAYMIQDFFDNLHMQCGEVPFTELPPVDDITIEDEDLRSNTPEVVQDLSCVASVCSQVQV